MQNWLNLDHKVVIVTGGTSGIGKAIIDELIKQNVNVVQANIKASDDFVSTPQVTFVQTDVSSKSSIDNLGNKTIEKFGHVDAIVDNAGINLPRLLVDSNQDKPQFELTEAEDYILQNADDI